MVKWDYKKRTERGVPHIYMLAPREVVLVIRKFVLMLEKDGFWHGIKRDILSITYSILKVH